MAPSGVLARSSQQRRQRKLTDFSRRVYAITRRIPRGQFATYKSIAAALHAPSASRAVGNALRHNPYAPMVPCHRVVSSDFRLTGFMGATDLQSEQMQMKARLLIEEGVTVSADGRVTSVANLARLDSGDIDSAEMADAALMAPESSLTLTESETTVVKDDDQAQLVTATLPETETVNA